MDWWLIRRDEAEFAAVAAGIKAEQVAESRLFRDPYEDVVYLELTKC